MSRLQAHSYTEQPAGSPQPGEPAFLVVGKLRKPHGVGGEITMEVLTDFPERLKVGITLYAGKEYRPLLVRSLRWHDTLLLVAFQGIEDSDVAGELRNSWVYVPAQGRPPLEPGEYYHHQLIGLQVLAEGAGLLGEIVDILETGSNDVLVVKPEVGVDVLLPFTDEVILEVDLAQRTVRARLLPGLLP